jgi:nucleoside-diphosphate-sugar epimerase
MRVLVTGHLGYIGAVLTPMLSAEGFEVAGLDSDLFRGCDFGPPPVPVPAATKDIRDVTAEDVRGFQAVIHLSGLANDALAELDPKVTTDVNYVATVRLAELCRKAGVARFLFSSTCSVYGGGGQDLLTEDSPLRPLTPYAESKAAAERALHELAADAFSPVCLRNATAYGISPRLRVDLALNNLVASAVTGGKVVLQSDGQAWRPQVHVEDLARAFIAVLNAPREAVHRQTFNVAEADGNYRIRELAEVACEAVPGAHVETAPDASHDARCYRVSGGKFARLVSGIRPEWDVHRGARQLAGAYRSAGLTAGRFHGPAYRRLAWARKLVHDGVLGSDLRLRNT